MRSKILSKLIFASCVRYSDRAFYGLCVLIKDIGRQLTELMPPPKTCKSEIGSQPTMCHVHTGAYVSLHAPGKTDHTACHPRKTTTYLLHVVPRSPCIRTTDESQLEKKKQRKKKKIKERKEKTRERKNEKGKERKGQTSYTFSAIL